MSSKKSSSLMPILGLVVLAVLQCAVSHLRGGTAVAYLCTVTECTESLCEVLMLLLLVRVSAGQRHQKEGIKLLLRASRSSLQLHWLESNKL
jgi:hypothetical protein